MPTTTPPDASSATVNEARGQLTLKVRMELASDARADLLEWRDKLRGAVRAWDAELGQSADGGPATAAELRYLIKSGGEVMLSATAPAMFAGLEHFFGVTVAPFFSLFSEGAQSYHSTGAAIALREFLAPEPTPHDSWLASQAERLVAAITEALAGTVTFTFEGAAVPEEEA